MKSKLFEAIINEAVAFELAPDGITAYRPQAFSNATKVGAGMSQVQQKLVPTKNLTQTEKEVVGDIVNQLKAEGTLKKVAKVKDSKPDIVIKSGDKAIINYDGSENNEVLDI